MVTLPQPGHIFVNKYRIIKLIGSGGFAQVYHAELEDVGRSVAIKILTPHDDPDLGGKPYPAEIDARFLREAKLVASLRDDNTITMYDFGRSESGLLYMVFEHIDGRALNEVLFQDGPLSPDLVKSILCQVLHSLREAHAKNVLHRDLKPANIMLFDYLGETRVKLLDFGIAKPMIAPPSGANYDVTQAGIMMGTPRYMSPEQICGHQLTPGSDIYSLGLVAYELLTGNPAIDETTSPTIVRRQLGPEEFRLPGQIHLPPELRHVVDGMTVKEVAKRFRSAQEVIDALNNIGKVSGTSFDEREPPTMPLTAASQDMAAQPQDMAQPQHFVGQPSRPLGQPSQHLGQPSQHLGQPSQHLGQPSQHLGQPSQKLGQVPQVPSGSGPQMVGQPFGAQPVQTGPNGVSVMAHGGRGIVNQPRDTAITIERGPEGLLVEIPGTPRRHSMILLGAAGLAFVVAISLHWALTIAASVFALWAIGMMFRSATIIVSPAGWEVSHTFLTLTTRNKGAVEQLVCVREDVENDRRFLRLITEKKAATVMSDLSPGENAWVSHQVNSYVQELRTGSSL